MKANQTLYIVSLLFVLTVPLVSCGSLDAASSTDVPDKTDNIYQDTVHLITDPYGPLLDRNSQTDMGYYELLLSVDAESNNILYTDFESKQRIYLCSSPGCTHNNNSCTSWIDATAGGSFLFIGPSGQQLYYVQRGTEDTSTLDAETTGKIFAMDLDGSQRHVLFDIAESGRICDAIAADSNYFYIDINTVDPSIFEAKKQVWRIDAKTGSKEVLVANLPADTRLFGAFGTELLFQQQGETGVTFRAFDLRTGSFRDLCGWEYDDFDGISTVYGQQLFVLAKQAENKGILIVYDLQSQETVTIEGVPIYGGDLTSFVGLYDNTHLVLETTDNTDPDSVRFLRYMVDLSTGDVRELTLTYTSNGYSYPLPILAETNDDLLVTYDTYTGHMQTVMDGQTLQLKVPEAPRRALINKEDFWNNVPNYQIITDSVMGE